MEGISKLKGRFSKIYKKFPRCIDYITLTLFTIFVQYPYFTNKVYAFRDMPFFISRMRSGLAGFKDFQIVSQLDPNALWGAGHSWNMFYGPLPTYFIIPFRIVFRNWVLAFNVFGIAVNLVSVLFIYLLIKEKVFDYSGCNLSSRFAGIFGGSIMCLFIGYNLGSASYATPFIILMLMGLYKISYDKKYGIHILITGLTGIILTHAMTTLLLLIVVPLLLFFGIKYLLLDAKGKFKLLFISGATSLLLSAFFILPLIELKLSGNYNVFDKKFQVYQMWATADNVNAGRISISYSLLHGENVFKNTTYLFLFIMVTFLWGICLPSVKNKQKLFCFVPYYFTCAILIFMMSLRFNWHWMPRVFDRLQTCARLGSFVDIFVAILCGGVAGIIFPTLINKNKFVTFVGIIYFFLILTIFKGNAPFINSPKWYNLALSDIGYFSSADVERSDWTSRELSTGEYVTTPFLQGETTGMEKSTSKIEIAYRIRKQVEQGVHCFGDASIKDIKRNGSRYDFNVNNKSNQQTYIQLPQIYYPGYRAYGISKGKKIFIQSSMSKNGMLCLKIPSSFHGRISSYFGMSKATKVGFFITVVTIFGIVIRFIILGRRGLKK